MFNIARKENTELDLRLGLCYKMPYKEKFDIVLMALVIHYFSDWNKVFKEVSRVLNKSGIFIFSTDNLVTNVAKTLKINKKKIKALGIRSYVSEK